MYSRFVSLIKDRPLQFLFIVFSILILKELIYIQTFRNDVSPIADGFSEANTIRGAVSFHELGLKKNFGLPDISYGVLLPKRGAKGYEIKEIPVPTENVIAVPVESFSKAPAYTHYPPGPEYMAWLGFHIVGVGNFNALRFLPILLSIFVGIFFIKTHFNLLGGGLKGCLLVLSLILPPMYSNFIHGLHHQQYAFLMFQTQICLAIHYCTKKENTFLTLISFALLGFAQGYMTFDYAFLATLFIIPFYLYFHAPFSTLATVGLASGLSFTFAHALHFYQVVKIYGDVQKAIQDFVGSAAHRAHNAANELDKPLDKYDSSKIGPFTVMKDYLYRVAGRGKYLSVNLINFIWIIIGLKFIKRITFKKGWTFEFEISGRDVLTLASAVIISSLWSIVMKQHAHIHGFIARHYFFAYYFCCLILISRTKRIS